jgi:hypothetical protein
VSRHRRREYEIREVEGAALPATAYRDNTGRIIVEVDAALRGAARDDAIRTALEPFRRGWLGLAPVPLLALAWETSARVMREHQRAAAAVASVTVTAAAGMSGLAVTGTLDGERHRTPVVAASTVTRSLPSATVTPLFSVPPTAASTRNPTPEPSRRPAQDRIGEQEAGRAEPAFQEPPSRTAGEPSTRPTPHLTRTSRAPAPAREPSPARTSAAGEADSPREASRPTRAADPPASEQPRPQTSPPPQPEPQPEPEPTRGRDPLIDVRVGDDCRLPVGVGDLLGVCLG